MYRPGCCWDFLHEKNMEEQSLVTRQSILAGERLTGRASRVATVIQSTTLSPGGWSLES